MLRNAFIVAVLLTLLLGCRRPAPVATGSSSFGDGGTILRDVFSSALGDYRKEGAEILWSGSDNDEKFSKRGSVTIKDADIHEIGDLLDAKLESLAATHEWNAHGRSRSGDQYIGLSYEEKGARFFIDLILTQKDKDVDILVLYKGVRK